MNRILKILAIATFSFWLVIGIFFFCDYLMSLQDERWKEAFDLGYQRGQQDANEFHERELEIFKKALRNEKVH